MEMHNKDLENTRVEKDPLCEILKETYANY
jgi:hypothetical protein